MSHLLSHIFSDLTIIFQGGIPKEVNSDGRSMLSALIQDTRAIFPSSVIMLSTWEEETIPDDVSVDCVVLNIDPGSLPPLKSNSPKQNNVNRQIVSTLSGLKNTRTRFAIKIRTDMYFNSSQLFNTLFLLCGISGFEKRIYVSRFFSLTGKTFEKIPYHISDWVQFGLTETLTELWDVPLMNQKDAVWFVENQRSIYSNFYESFFNAKFAVEQYIYMQYANKLGYMVPDFINDCNKQVQSDYEKFVSTHLVILDDEQWGIIHTKYPDIAKSKFHDLNCLSHADWVWYTKRKISSKLIYLIKSPSYLARLMRIKFYGALASHSRLPVYDYKLYALLKLALLKVIRKYKMLFVINHKS